MTVTLCGSTGTKQTFHQSGDKPTGVCSPEAPTTTRSSPTKSYGSPEPTSSPVAPSTESVCPPESPEGDPLGSGERSFHLEMAAGVHTNILFR